MDYEEANNLRISSLRKRGKDSPYLHPDMYARAGSVLNLCGVDWAVPSLYPSNAMLFLPTFGDGDNVAVAVETDEAVLDKTLVGMADRIRDSVTIEDSDMCDSCGRFKQAHLNIDAEKDSELITVFFQYARRCLQKLYDLSTDDLQNLLRFTGSELPTWVLQVLDHTVATRTTLEV